MSQQYSIIRRVYLTENNHSTGRTRHYHGNKEIPVPTELRIVKYDDDPGYYLLYFDENENELTDTYHSSIVEAFAQAEWEFKILPDQWDVFDSIVDD